uniref:Uncharacterized protein n=1 Tax=Caenorhabditis tropicalis TaxID=1561998 RepID=A0A1I7THT2_9PELO
MAIERRGMRNRSGDVDEDGGQRGLLMYLVLTDTQLEKSEADRSNADTETCHSQKRNTSDPRDADELTLIDIR